jgi:SanA protein
MQKPCRTAERALSTFLHSSELTCFGFMRRNTYFALLLIGLTALAAAATYLCNQAVNQQAKGRLYSKVEATPYNRVGLLLGTGKYLPNGRPNPYYRYRIEASLALLRAGRIKYLVVSGDNGRPGYNEPVQMKRDLVTAGIDSPLIYLDYAGFRTFDSVVRFKKVFGQDSATIISQPFHNERALYLASREGIEAIGFNARDVGRVAGLRVQAREKLARVKLFMDYLVNREPKFLGPRVQIP